MIGVRLVTAAALSVQLCLAKAAPNVNLDITATTADVDSDWTSIYYSRNDSPLLIGNDKSPDKGGMRAYSPDVKSSKLPEETSVVNGRTKILTTVYNVGGKDLAITIAAPDSIIRVFELPSFEAIEDAEYSLLGDWSAICPWRSDSGDQYFFLFGKGQGVQFLVKSDGCDVELVKIQTFDLPFEPSGCAASQAHSLMYLSTDDDPTIYGYPLSESTAAPAVKELATAADDITGLAVYASSKTNKDFLFVASEGVIGVYNKKLKLKGTMTLTGMENIEIQGLSVYQAATDDFPSGLVGYAVESDTVAGFGASSLEGVLDEFGIEANTGYDPRHRTGCRPKSPICDTCQSNGYCVDGGQDSVCECFAGFAGRHCGKFTCTDDCSGNGKCVEPDMCACDAGWGGLHCSFVLVEPSYETDANGGDGDDPAIWISPVSNDLSRIVTTTKSEEGAGLVVFDLKGHLLQVFPAGEPDNVDMIYDFDLGDRTVDLAFAACRDDDTLCLFEMTPNGTLQDISGGSQPVIDDFTVYGSCVYRSKSSHKQYLFVNSKTAQYLQYELTALPNGTLSTTLVRTFQGGSGGQVEGCVTDEENGWLILGEEPSALWRYDAEPDGSDKGYKIAEVGDGTLYGDVEGVTLVYGKNPDEGFIMTSCQGVSAYSIFERAPPHSFVASFTITPSSDGTIDGVTNTDGITAVGARLGRDFPHGLFVTHDDANQLPDGTTSAEASYKLVGLDAILGGEALKGLGLLGMVDEHWDPRA